MTHRYLLLGCLVTACGGGTGGPTAQQHAGDAGELQYVARATDDTPILEGRITLRFHSDSLVSGTWSIGWVPGADTTQEVGPQVGAGQLAGSRIGRDSFAIDLNPGFADNNVILTAVRSADGVTGTWYWATFAGSRGGGRFTAKRE